MQDCERGSAADWDWERASVEGSNVCAKRRSRRRWSAEEKARIVRESFCPGTRVEDVARRYGLSRKQLSAWRSLARQGKLAVPSSAEPVVVAPELQPAFATLVVDSTTGSEFQGTANGNRPLQPPIARLASIATPGPASLRSTTKSHQIIRSHDHQLP